MKTSNFAAGLLAIAMTLTALAQGDEPAVYQPTGALADTKVEARWNYYRDYAQATELLKQIVAAHPELCKLESLGTSYGKREMWVLTITAPAKDGDKESKRVKPAMWIDGGIHANEVQAVDVVLYTAWYLTESYGRNEMATKLLDERVFYLMPMMSPDSRDAHMYEANTTHSPRGGTRPVDDDRDGKFDEDPADDLDGDGHITMMRVRDPLGRMKSHPDYPALMIRAKPEEEGQYRIVGPEGIDNDGDGQVNEDDTGYYDPNRDWAWQWQPGYVQRGAYKYPFSVPENRMVADFIMKHPNIAGAQSYHNTGGFILRGPGTRSERFPQGDLTVYDRLGKQGEKMLPGYKYTSTIEDLYEVWGGETDWLYAMLGIYAFTNELNTPFNLFRKASGDGAFFAGEEDRALFDKYLLMDDGSVAWHEVDHPQYGKVEVGGFKKNWGRQPPSFMLEEECHRNMAFTLWHADQMPQVEIVDVATKSLGDDLTQITATFLNRKVTPTHASIDVEKKITRPDLATIATGGDGKDDVEVVAAMTAEEPAFLRARDIRHNPHQVQIETLESRRPVYVRWLVRGKGPWKVELDSVKGGQVTADASVE